MNENSKDDLSMNKMEQSCSQTFDSLGLTLEDGKPKFRLNEPAFSNINIPLLFHLEKNNDDDDDDISFVVLGKSSLDFINNASLISYQEIQEKSMAVDYNSIISALSHEEIESKVAELLQENMKLKETLTQNNTVMKSQFNKLISWQEELMKVHENHKQKFTETRNMISLLQQENTELKTKLTCSGSMMDSQFSRPMIRQSIDQEKNCENDYVQCGNSETPVNLSLQSTVTNCDDKIRNTVDIDDKKALELIKKQNRDLHYQQEVISSLKAQLQAFMKISFKPVELEIKNDIGAQKDKNRQQFADNFLHYNEKLSNIVKSYAAQTSRFTNIQDCLKLCVDVLTTIDINSSSDVDELKNILEDCRQQLINEQLQNITERQDLITAQNQFQKIFSDYNSVLHELEILRVESCKPTEKINDLDRQKEELMENMMKFADEKQELKSVKEKLLAEKIMFEQKQTSLEEAKASLNSQSILYETEMKTLQDNMKDMQKRHDDMLKLYTKSKEELEQKNIELDGVRARLSFAVADAETLEILREQLESYKSDFEEEKKSKEQLFDEREYLTEQLGKWRDHTQQLLQRLNGPNPEATPQDESDEHLANMFCTACGLYKVPGHWHGPGFCQPMD